MKLPFDLPLVWKKGEVLQYDVRQDGWNTALTTFHEETAGENHFIDKASRQHALQEIQQYVTQHNPVILEVGCSSGFFIKTLKENGQKDFFLMGSDVVYEPLSKLAQAFTDIPFFQFDLTRCPLPDHSVDAIVMLNVLEHIENDTLALQQIHRLLKPKGILVIEVPANPKLFDVYDKLLQHYRRYVLSNLKKQVHETGFNLLKASHLGCFIYPGFWLAKKRNQYFMSEDLAKQKARVQENIQNTGNNRFMHWIMQTELALGKYMNYPFGIRCLVTCQKGK